jgi:hypothetical protein
MVWLVHRLFHPRDTMIRAVRPNVTAVEVLDTPHIPTKRAQYEISEGSSRS